MRRTGMDEEEFFTEDVSLDGLDDDFSIDFDDATDSDYIEYTTDW